MKVSILTWLILLSPWFCLAQDHLSTYKDKADREKALLEFEYLKTHNPQTGEVHTERLYEQMEKLRVEEEAKQDINVNKITGVGSSDRWIELGPLSQGGRIRAMAIVDYQGRKLAFAGGVSGGLWQCEDISVANPYWRRVNDYFDNLNISSIAIYTPPPINGVAQKPVIYFGTGEIWGKVIDSPIPSIVALKGAGLWRSIDAGASWARLSSTKGIDFNFVQKLVVDYNGYLYAGTFNGLFRSTATGINAGGLPSSTNQSANWTAISVGGTSLSNIGDIEVCNGLSTPFAMFASQGIDGNTPSSVYRSTNGVTWEDITGGAFSNGRIELTTTPNQPERLFASHNGTIYRLDNALTIVGGSTTNWNTVSSLGTAQNEYNNILTVDPHTTSNDNPEDITLYFGAGKIYRLTGENNNTTNVFQISNLGFPNNTVHVDQHLFICENVGSATKMYICNDGGIFRSTDVKTPIAPTYTSLNNNLFITQCYTAAISEGVTRSFLAGTQDNSTFKFDESGLTLASTFGTGDGAYCHFGGVYTDFITSDQQASIKSWNGSGLIHSFAPDFAQLPTNTAHWLFITPTELDKTNSILYVSGDNDELFRISNVFSANPTTVKFTIAEMNNAKASALKVSPNNPSILYIGTTSGRLICLPNANTSTNSNPTGVSLHAPSSSTTNYVSSIDVMKTVTGNDAEVAFTISNYGQASIYYRSDMGNALTSFQDIDNSGILGDIPVRSVVFAPYQNSQGIKLLIGTDLGVWTTDNIPILQPSTTQWTKFPINRGMPNVRIDMLKFSPTDNMLVAATFGRGLMRSDMFCTQKINFTMSNPDAKKDCPVYFADASTGYPSGTYKRRWEVRQGSTLLPSYSNTTGNGFSIPCKEWNPDMTVYLKMTDATGGTVYSRIGRPIYYMTTAPGPNPSTCPPCGGNGTNRQSSSAINIYPNPSQDGVFHIENADLIQELSVFDISGRAISFSREEETLRIENVVTGVYFYRILQNDGNVLTGKLLVE